MATQPVTYRGFFIQVEQRRGLGWCARWEELTGSTLRQAFDQGSAGEALEHAKAKIDEHHRKLDKAKYRAK